MTTQTMPPAATVAGTRSTPAAAAQPASGSLVQLRRVRWAVRTTLVLGVAASVAANILHANPNPVSQTIAAWPPLALLLTVELIARVPVHRRSLAAVRLAATATIAGIAAWVSYWHIAGVAARYGETGASPYLLPLSVDGLVIVASVSLVELAGRIRTAEPVSPAGSPWQANQTRTSPMVEGVGSHAVVPPTTAPLPHNRVNTGERPAPPALRSNEPHNIPPDTTSRRKPLTRAAQPPIEPAARSDTPVPDAGPQPRSEPESPPPPEPDAKPDGEQRADQADASAASSQTAAAVAYWYRQNPTMHPAVIAEKIGKSERTVRRYWPPRSNQPDSAGVNGRHVADLADAVTPD